MTKSIEKAKKNSYRLVVFKEYDLDKKQLDIKKLYIAKINAELKYS